MNVELMKSKIAQAIEKMPTEINLKRYAKSSDGMGGYTKSKSPISVAPTFNALLDNSVHNPPTIIINESSTIEQSQTAKLYVVYDKSFSILEGDFFIIGHTKYTVKKAVNILNLNIYYECDLGDEEV